MTLEISSAKSYIKTPGEKYVVVTVRANSGRCLATYGYYEDYQTAIERHAFSRLPHAHVEIHSVTVSERRNER